MRKRGQLYLALETQSVLPLLFCGRSDAMDDEVGDAVEYFVEIVMSRMTKLGNYNLILFIYA